MMLKTSSLYYCVMEFLDLQTQAELNEIAEEIDGFNQAVEELKQALVETLRNKVASESENE
jgi:hypothetical protein